MVTIYTLSDNSGVRYVGKTIKNTNTRLSSHISETKSGRYTTHRHNWIKGLLINNDKPVIEIIDVVNNKSWIRL